MRFRSGHLSTAFRLVSVDAEVPNAAEQAWGDAIHRLATSHRLRRELDAAVRWPLTHACVHAPFRKESDVHVIPLDIEAAGSGLNRVKLAHHAFCCGAER